MAQRNALKIGIMTAAVVGTVAVPATALAANATGTSLRSLAGGTVVEHREGGAFGERRQGHLEGLAESLGITVEELQAAIEATRTELGMPERPATPEERQAAQDQYLATLAGKLGITVDALQAALDENRPERPEGGHGPGLLRRVFHVDVAGLAEALGVTPEALAAAIRDARESTKPEAPPADEAAREAQQQAYVAALAANLGLPVEQVQAAIDAHRPTAEEREAAQAEHLERMLGQMVEHGRITQEQADQILADVEAGKPVFEALRTLLPELGERGPWERFGDRGPGERGPGEEGPQRLRVPRGAWGTGA